MKTNNLLYDDESIIKVGRVKDLHGEFSCMSPHPIFLNNQHYRTCEALFQFDRFKGHPDVQQQIFDCPSPMGAKMIARKNRNLLKRGKLWDQSEEDIERMRFCLKLKLEQHPELLEKLLSTGDKLILEDCTTHDRESARFWGMVFKDGKWIGENHLGKLWMELRDEFKINNLYIPKRLFISPSTLEFRRTQEMIIRIKNLNPEVEIIYLKNQTPELPNLSPSERYLYIKESLILCTRTADYMEVFASPGNITENLGVVGKIHSHCPLRCQYCYLDVSGRSVPWVRVYVDFEIFYEQAVKERLVYSIVQSLWSAISFHLKESLNKVPEGFKSICDKNIRNEVLIKRSKVISQTDAIEYLKNNLEFFFKKMGLKITPEEKNSLKKEIPNFFKENSKYPLTINISEYTDVLGLDHITTVMDELMKLVHSDSDFLIKFRTKSANIHNLLKYDGKNQVDVTFSLNTKYVTDNFEKHTSDLDEMITAIKLLQKRGGYKIQIAIEPIIKYPGFKGDYLDLVKKLKSEVNLEAISKIKIGTVRYKTILKNYIEKVHTGSSILSKQNFIEPEKGDKRWRYSKEERINIYSLLKAELKSVPGLKLGLASENPELWDSLELNKNGIHNDVVFQYKKG